MTVKFDDSIDVTIFMGLQISKKCLEIGDNIPILFLSNPGIGKSTAVALFAEVNDYDLVLLRISNETPDTLTGYDIAVTNTESATATAAKHIRPSWFQKILDNHKNGKKSILFLDEITTSDPYTQGAALNIVFDRRCHSEKLPGDTLICAAGNYAQNLTSEMTILAPMLNRFAIINILPKSKDLDHFLCKYNGSTVGHRINFMDEIRHAMSELIKQEKNIGGEFLDCIGETFENAIRDEAKQYAKEKILNLAVTELKDIYSDMENDEPVPNYFTLRTVNYLRDAAVGCYICFGNDGIKSDTFRRMIYGLVGLCVSRDGSKGDVKKTIITDRMYNRLVDASNDIERMFDNKLPIYQGYFKDILNKSKKAMSPEDIVLTSDKLKEFLADKGLKNIDRPIDPEIIKGIFDKVLGMLSTNVYDNIDFSGDTDDAIQNALKDNPDKYAGYVANWNKAADLINLMKDLTAAERHYPSDVSNYMNKSILKCRRYNHQLKVIRKILKTIPNCTGFVNSTPDIKEI